MVDRQRYDIMNDDWREVACALLLAPHLGAVSPYIRTEACIRLGHPLTPRGGCPCGKVKP